MTSVGLYFMVGLGQWIVSGGWWTERKGVVMLLLRISSAQLPEEQNACNEM